MHHGLFFFGVILLCLSLVPLGRENSDHGLSLGCFLGRGSLDRWGIIIQELFGNLTSRTFSQIKNEKSAQRGSFPPDIPADIRPKTFVSPSKDPGKKQAFRHGHAVRTSSEKLRSEKLRSLSKGLVYKLGGALRQKRDVYCRVSLLQSLEARKVQRHKWGMHCCTNWRCRLYRYVVLRRLQEWFARKTRNLERSEAWPPYLASRGNNLREKRFVVLPPFVGLAQGFANFSFAVPWSCVDLGPKRYSRQTYPWDLSCFFLPRGHEWTGVWTTKLCEHDQPPRSVPDE